MYHFILGNYHVGLDLWSHAADAEIYEKYFVNRQKNYEQRMKEKIKFIKSYPVGIPDLINQVSIG